MNSGGRGMAANFYPLILNLLQDGRIGVGGCLSTVIPA